ncbi:MAG: HAD hydrolase family protein [Calothrix sp. FI2-JRJ7]|nr:HAD hydrolase family protein [Calothrix sp. FI2-JRJ7]
MSSASDYDGTLATDGHVHDATKDALKRLRTSGRKLILVTGRELDDLQRLKLIPRQTDSKLCTFTQNRLTA